MDDSLGVGDRQSLGDVNSYAEAEKALEHYTRFVEWWKNCDPELRPLVDDAQARIEWLRKEVR